MKKVAIFLAKGFEEIEVISIIDILRRVDIIIDLITVSNSLEVEGSHGIRILADDFITNFNSSNYNMIILPGGQPGTTNLELSNRVKKIIIQFNLEEKYIGAICAAPTILGKSKILEGKKATCYPGLEAHLYGAIVQKECDVVVDQNIITSRGPGTTMKFALKLVEILKDKKTSKEVAIKLLV